MYEDTFTAPRRLRAGTPEERLPATVPTAAIDSDHPLDDPDVRALWDRNLGFYQIEIERHAANRREMELDHAYYDNDQFDEETKTILEERGQKPVTYNVVGTTVDWILGTEQQTRADFRILPRQKEYGEQARYKTEVLKYLGDVNGIRFHRSRAFADAVKGGVGWLEDIVTDDAEGEIIESGYESWRNIHWDSMSRRPDLDDARYLFRSRWLDLDIVQAWFPERAHIASLSANRVNEFGSYDLAFGDDSMDYQEENASFITPFIPQGTFQRDRLRVIEAWYRRPVMVDRVSGGQFHGEIFDPASRGHLAEVKRGNAEIVTRRGMRMHAMIMTPAGVLWNGESPYRHNKFPFTPIWGFRRDKDNMPYGIIRRLRGMQDKVNISATKVQAILSTNKVIMDEGALGENADLDEFRDEVARPNAIIVKKKGSELTIDADRQLAAGFDAMFSRDVEMIQQAAGVTDENLGRRTNAASGIAIERRQNQGMLSTAGFFDNYLAARLQQGEKQLSLVEQWYTERREIRVINARGTPSWIKVNSGAEVDDITRSKADFTVAEDDWRATVRQANADQLLELAGKLAPTAPQIVLIMLDLVVESMDIPNRDEIVARIRKALGLSDPDAEQPTPEEMARQQSEAEAAARAKALEEATVAEKQASAAQKKATADHTASKIAREGVGTQGDAMQAALAVSSAPAIAPVADHILREAGFKGRTESEDDAAQAMALQQLAQAAQPPEAPPGVAPAAPPSPTNQPPAA